MFVAGTVVATTTLLALVGAWSLQLPQFYQAPSLPFRGYYHDEPPRFFLENHFRHPFQFYQSPGISVPQPPATTLPPPPPPPPPPNPSLQPRSVPAQVTNVHHHVFYYYYLPAMVESTPRPRATPTPTATGSGLPNKQLCVGDDGADVAVVSPPMYLPPPAAPPTELPSLPDPPSTQAPCDDTVVVDNVDNLLDYPFGRSAKTIKQTIQSQSYQNPGQQLQLQQIQEGQQIPQQQTIQQSQWIPQQQQQQQNIQQRQQDHQQIPQQLTIQQSQWIPQQQQQHIQQRQQNHQQIQQQQQQQQQQQYLQQQLHRKLVSSRNEGNVAEKKNGFVLANFLLPPDH